MDICLHAETGQSVVTVWDMVDMEEMVTLRFQFSHTFPREIAKEEQRKDTPEYTRTKAVPKHVSGGGISGIVHDGYDYYLSTLCVRVLLELQLRLYVTTNCSQSGI